MTSPHPIRWRHRRAYKRAGCFSVVALGAAFVVLSAAFGYVSHRQPTVYQTRDYAAAQQQTIDALQRTIARQNAYALQLARQIATLKQDKAKAAKALTTAYSSLRYSNALVDALRTRNANQAAQLRRFPFTRAEMLAELELAPTTYEQLQQWRAQSIGFGQLYVAP
jgi:septal ring factor EnvC (AmiA/AmiB activator)